MPSSSSHQGVLRFGVFEVDVRARELRKNGSRVKLQHQPFELLLILVDRPGDVVTREELRTRLWPADVYVDFDRSLNKAIVKLREALGDSSGCPIYVETLPPIEYRFIGPLNGTTPPAERVAAAISRHATEFARDEGTTIQVGTQGPTPAQAEHFGPRVCSGHCAPRRLEFRLGE